MTRKERYAGVIDWFLKNRPDASTELKYQSPYELIVAVILSAQCTDKRVNMITPAFFKKFPDPAALAASNEAEVFEVIKSCSYPNNKSKNLLGMARKLVNEMGGVLPSDIEKLMELPGVGRKTANVLAAVLFDQPAMPVDTHVFRVAARIGLTVGAKNPLQTEKQLIRHIPVHLVSLAHHWLILHGRYVCTARNPKCMECGIRDYCKYFSEKKRKEIVNNSRMVQ